MTLPNGVNAFDRRLRIDANGVSYRYLTLRSYRPDDRLRIDSLNFYGTTAEGVGSAPSAPPVASSSGRRLGGPEPLDDPDPRPELKAIYETFLEPMGYKTVPGSFDDAYTLVEHFLVKHVGPMESVNRSNWPQPEERASGESDEDDEDVAPPRPRGWWLEIESVEADASRGMFGSYPLRSAPNARIASPSHSLAVALSLKNESDSGLPDLVAAEAYLINTTCSHVGGCTRTQYAHPLFDFEPSQWHFEDHPRLDDGAMASWALAAVVAPAVDALLWNSLFCASPELCDGGGEACALCERVSDDGMFREGNDRLNYTAATVAAEVELQLLGGLNASQDPLACSRNAECLQQTSERAAYVLGTLPFSDVDTLGRVADANAELLDSFLALNTLNMTHNNTAPARLVLARKHAEAVGADMRKRAQAQAARGRRLGDVDAESPADRNFTANERLLYAATSAVRDLIVAKGGFENVTEARQKAVRVWALVGAIGDWPGGKGACADPQLPNRTIACTKFFSLTAKFLKRMRVDKENLAKYGSRRRKLTQDSQAELTKHVEQNLDRVCCAKFELDGREECGRKYCEVHMHQENARRMAVVLTTKHPDALEPSAHAMIENVLLPHTHPDSQCHTVNKSTLAHGGPSRWECMGKSFVTHASKKYGLDPETVGEKIRAAGYSMGEGIEAIQRAMGMFHEVRSSGERLASSVVSAARRPKSDAKSRDAATASRMLKAARAVQGRMLQDDAGYIGIVETDEEAAQRLADTRGVGANRGGRRHGFGHVAKRVAHERARARNVSNGVSQHFRRMEQEAQKQRLEAIALGRAGGAARVAPSRIDHFHGDTIKKSAVTPGVAMEALQADEGSLASRFRRGLEKLNEVVGRWQNAHYESQLLDVRRRRERRLEEEAPRRKLHASLYDQIDARDRARPPHKRARRLEIPSDHRFSWVHDVVDWNALADEWTRLHDVFVERHRMRMEGRSLREIVHKHPAQYSLFDSPEYFSISAVGDAFRRLWHRKVNGTDHHFVKHVKSDEDAAGKHRPARGARVRRLAEGLFGASSKAPYLFVDTVLYRGTPTEYSLQKTGETVWNAALKYVVYSTVGCYFQAPQEFVPDTQKGGTGSPSEQEDGSTLKVLRVEPGKLCFPSVPVALPAMPTWREFTKSENLDYYSLTFEEYCTGESFQQKALDFFENTLGISALSDTAVWLGIPGALRGAEAMDSVRNFVESAQASEGDAVIGKIFCGIVELGGLIYVVGVLIALSVALPLVVGVNSLASIVYDFLVAASARRKSKPPGSGSRRSLSMSLKGVARGAARRAGSVSKACIKRAATAPLDASLLPGMGAVSALKGAARVYRDVRKGGVRAAGAVGQAESNAGSAVRRQVKRRGSSSNRPDRKDNVSKKVDELFQTPAERVATAGFFTGIATRFGLGGYNEVSTSNSDYDTDPSDESADDRDGQDDAYTSPGAGRASGQEYV